MQDVNVKVTGCAEQKGIFLRYVSKEAFFFLKEVPFQEET